MEPCLVAERLTCSSRGRPWAGVVGRRPVAVWRRSHLARRGVDAHKEPHVEVDVHREHGHDVAAVPVGVALHAAEHDAQRLLVAELGLEREGAVRRVAFLGVRAGQHGEVRAGDHQQPALGDGLHRRVEEGSGGAVRVELHGLEAVPLGRPRRLHHSHRVARARYDGALVQPVAPHVLEQRGHRRRVQVVGHNLAHLRHLERISERAQARCRHGVEHAHAARRASVVRLGPGLGLGLLCSCVGATRLGGGQAGGRALTLLLLRVSLGVEVALPCLRKLLQREHRQVAVRDLRRVVEDALLRGKVQRRLALLDFHGALGHRVAAQAGGRDPGGRDPGGREPAQAGKARGGRRAVRVARKRMPRSGRQRTALPGNPDESAPGMQVWPSAVTP